MGYGTETEFDFFIKKLYQYSNKSNTINFDIDTLHRIALEAKQEYIEEQERICNIINSIEPDQH